MSVTNFIPEIWSASVLEDLLDVLVFAQIANTDYEGEITGQGDRVRINEVGDITINNYSRNSTSELTREYLSDAQKTIDIDYAKYFDFEVDDLDAFQAKNEGRIMSEAMRKASWGLANTIDEGLAALHSDAGNTIGSTGSGKDISSTNVLFYMSLMAQKLDEANVPDMGRWMIVPPWFAQKLTLMNIVQNTDNPSIIRNGSGSFLGVDMHGFAVYKSNNVVNGTPAANNAKVMAGYEGTISLAMQVNKTEAFRSQKRFTDEVRGLVNYGYKVIRPDALVTLTADYTAEST